MKIETKILKGVTTVFAHMPDANSTTLQVLVKAGSIYETRKTNGLSHFLEHMFFKGGKKYQTPKIVAETIDAFGGEFNAFTGDEYAGYYVKCAPQYTMKSLDVLADMMLEARFPKDELEREKGVVIQEIMMYEDMPQRQVMSKRQERYYGDNSYGWTTLGPVANIKSFTQEALFSHQKNLYTKDNLVIVIAGKIENQPAIEDYIGEYFGVLGEKKGVTKPELLPYKPGQHEGSYTKKTQQNHVIFSADGFSMHDDEKYAAKLLATLFGGTMSARLFQNIREKKGLCYYISAAHYDGDKDGTFIIRAGMDKEKRGEGKAAIYHEIEKIATGDIEKEELAQAIGNMKGKTQMGIETSDQLANFIAYQQLFKGKIKLLPEILAEYEKISLDQIKAVAQKLQRENVWTYWIE